MNYHQKILLTFNITKNISDNGNLRSKSDFKLHTGQIGHHGSKSILYLELQMWSFLHLELKTIKFS